MVSGGKPGPGLRLDVADIPEEEKEYDWTLEPELFMDCPSPLPIKGPFTASGTVYKSGETVYFSGRASGSFELICSRCAKVFSAPVEVTAEAVCIPGVPEAEAKAGEDEDEQDTDTVYYSGGVVDLFPPLRDQISLAEPMRPMCSEDCKGLCPVCGTDLNAASCNCKVTSGDPRFAGLKQLLDKKEGENAGS